MTYEHQRKILAYLRQNFKFDFTLFYFFDMAKIDVDKAQIDFEVFFFEKDFINRTQKAQKADEFHIIARPKNKSNFVLGVNGDGFDYFENLTTGEIKYDDSFGGPIDPIQLKLEMLLLIRDLNRDKAD